MNRGKSSITLWLFDLTFLHGDVFVVMAAIIESLRDIAQCAAQKTFRHCEVLAGWHCEVEHPALLCSSILRLNTDV